MHLSKFLAFAFVAYAGAQTTDWEQVHQTLHRYAPIIDMKRFAALDEVFAPNAFANYTGALANLTGYPAIQQGLTKSVTGLKTQHLLGTTVIDVHKDTAHSTTYVQAALIPEQGNMTTILYGYYLDDLSKRRQGWRIERRFFTIQGATSVPASAMLPS